MPAPLSTDNILRRMAQAIPTHAKDDTSDICSSYEAIALFSHACMIALGFRLLGFGEDQRLEECSRLAPRLSPKWNTTFNSFTFLYAHERSSMEYIIKVDRLGGKAEIRGIGLGDERISRFEVTAKDYISTSALPLRIKMSPEGEEDRSNLEERLKEIFISSSRIQDKPFDLNLASLFDLAIIKKITPSLGKGCEESPQTIPGIARDAHNEREEVQVIGGPHRNPLAEPQSFIPPLQPHPFHGPQAIHPHHPFPQGEFPPPGFDDEYDLLRPNPGYPSHPSRSPFDIGYDDLHPQGLGPRDPLRVSLGDGSLGRPIGGMHPTLDGPLFGGGYSRNTDPGRPQIPQGARYDPIGPGDELMRSGRPFNPFGGFRDGDII